MSFYELIKLIHHLRVKAHAVVLHVSSQFGTEGLPYCTQWNLVSYLFRPGFYIVQFRPKPFATRF